jgi:hypothetical protein
VLAERGGEHGLVGAGLELAAGRDDADLHAPIIAAPKEKAPQLSPRGPEDVSVSVGNRLQVVIEHVLGDRPALPARLGIREAEMDAEKYAREHALL